LEGNRDAVFISIEIELKGFQPFYRLSFGIFDLSLKCIEFKEVSMPHKKISMTIVVALFAFAMLGFPKNAMAGGVCGGAYTADPGDTVDKLAAMCGIPAQMIYSANPGLSNNLTTGKTIIIPGLGAPSNNPAPTTPVPTPSANAPDTSPAFFYGAFSYFPSQYNSGTYIVQWGDTFDKIAAQFKISHAELWGANPQIWDFNLLYPGQVIYIPNHNVNVFVPPPPQYTYTAPETTDAYAELIYPGDISSRAPTSTVILKNNSGTDVYVSLRITRADGTNAIYEYSVPKQRTVEIPVGWIDIVASVGGNKLTNGFKLHPDDEYRVITFNKSKVHVD